MKQSDEFENLSPETKEFVKQLQTYIQKKQQRRNKMAYRWYKQELNTFDQVAKRYADVKPIVSKNHSKEDDIRPICVRQRKWERIIKISDDCYILNDGSYDNHNFWYYGKDDDRRKFTPNELISMSPIVWWRVKGGDGKMYERIKVRNGSGQYGHTSRYTFLENMLPDTLTYRGGGNGLQYIAFTKQCNDWDNKRNWFYLPKSDYCPIVLYNCNNNKQAIGSGWALEDDHKYISFIRPYDKDSDSRPWSVDGKSYVYTHPKKRIDKVAKAEIKPLTDKFYDYILAMFPLIDMRVTEDGRMNWHDYQDLKEGLHKEWCKFEGKDDDNGWFEWNGKREFFTHILTVEDHPSRITLLELFIYDSELRAVKSGDTQVDDNKLPSIIRNQWNRWVNKIFDLEYLHSNAGVYEKDGKQMLECVEGHNGLS